MLPGPRIVCVPNPSFQIADNLGEGPFDSLEELKKSSQIFRELLITDPRRAEKITKDKFIVQVKELVYAPLQLPEDFLAIVYYIMQHSFNGRIERKDVKGVHVFNPSKTRIVETIKIPNKFGIFVATIEVLNERTSLWIRKSRETTFFPSNWSYQGLVQECYVAYLNRTLIEPGHFEGITLSGIKVVFIYRNNNFKSVYPIYEEDVFS